MVLIKKVVKCSLLVTQSFSNGQLSEELRITDRKRATMKLAGDRSRFLPIHHTVSLALPDTCLNE